MMLHSTKCVSRDLLLPALFFKKKKSRKNDFHRDKTLIEENHFIYLDVMGRIILKAQNNFEKKRQLNILGLRFNVKPLTL